MGVVRTLLCLAMMGVAAAGLAAALTASGAALHPASTPTQGGLLLLGLLLLCVAHALRSRVAVRAVAVTAKPGPWAVWRDLELVATGAVILVAFTCPTWRPSAPRVVLAERHDRLFDIAPPPVDDQQIHVGTTDSLTILSEVGRPGPPDDVPLERGEVVGPRLGVSLEDDAPGGRLRFSVADDSFAWRLPGKRLRVSAEDDPTKLRDRLKDAGLGAIVAAAPGPDVWPLDRLIGREAPVYDEPKASWGEFAIFPSGTPLASLAGRQLGVRALPSLSSKGGDTQFERPNDRFGTAYPIALTRSSQHNQALMVEYAWVQFGPEGRPVLSAGGGETEPLDALGESLYRRVPREILESYALAWRRIDAGSPRLALLPVQGQFRDATRRLPRLARSLDVPRGLGVWEPLGVIALFLLVRRFR